MRVDKVILRAALSSLAAVVILIGVMIFSLCYLFPATMMNITYDLGMDNASITCAKRSYNRTEQVYYIAFATEVAIVSENSEQIAECGKKFVGDNEQLFVEYCNEKNQSMSQGVNGTYEQYIFGQICAAEYKLGDTSQAISDAFAYLHGAFPVNNSVVTLLFTAMHENDTQTVNEIVQELSSLQLDGFSKADLAYYQDIVSAME